MIWDPFGMKTLEKLGLKIKKSSCGPVSEREYIKMSYKMDVDNLISE